MSKVFYRDPPHPEAPKLVPDSHGLIWMPEDGFRRAVAHKASGDQTSIAAAVQRPIALQCIQEPAPKPAWKAKPSWYLLAEEDRMINPKTFHGKPYGREDSIPARGPHSDVHTAESCDRRDRGSCASNLAAIRSLSGMNRK